jgi:membrane protein DedA with SNARE-associated domain
MWIWIFAFAYGRMTDEITAKPFLILGAISMLLTLFFMKESASNHQFVAMFAGEFAGNLIGFSVAFALGVYFGKWLDRNKDPDRFSD